MNIREQVEEVEQLLVEQPTNLRMLLTYRSAMRVLPILLARMEDRWATGHDIDALPILRVALFRGLNFEALSSIAGAFPSQFDDDINEVAQALVYDSTYDGDALDALTAMNQSIVASMDTYRYAAGHGGGEISRPEIWAAAMNDMRILARGDDPMQTPLWSSGPPDWFNAADAETRKIWAADVAPESWAFWTKWWDAAIAGKPLHWELQREVALIPDAVWQEGPEAVAKAIAEIEARFGLLAEVATLRGKLQEFEAATALQAFIAHRAHNHPPELLEPEVAVQTQISVMVRALLEAEEDLAKPNPSPALLKRVAGVLVTGAKAIALYCGSLADTALQKGAEEIGTSGVKWALGLGGVSLALQLEPIQQVAKALADFARVFLGG